MHHLNAADRLLANVLLGQSRRGHISGALIARLASTKLDEMVPVVVDFPARHIGPRIIS